jgi:hypothetical protein
LISELNDIETSETGEEKVKIMIVTFFELFIKNPSWNAKATILHTTVPFYGDRMKTCGRFVPNV